MDKLFVGDIPSEYHYASFSNNYIDLYNVQYLLPNQEYDFYRIYMYDNQFMYSHLSTTTGYYTNTTNTIIETTDNVMYRRDIDSIFLVTFIVVLLAVFLINIVTSAIRRGGILGGLI